MASRSEIPASGQYDSRLSELIWRSVKLRISILIVCIFFLLTTWSSLEVGNRNAREIDKSNCLKVADDAQQRSKLEHRAFLQRFPDLQKYENENGYPIQAATDFCAELKNIHYYLQSLQAEMKASNPQKAKDEEEIENNIWKSLSDYESKRKEAYRIELKIASEYSENNVEANALSVAAAIPFIVISLLVLYFMIGRQEGGLRNQLRLEVARLDLDETGSPDRLAAKSQYFVSPRDRVGKFGLLQSLNSPDKFANILLLFSTLYLLFTVTGEFVDELPSLTDSVFGGYSFWLYAVSFFAILLVIASHRHFSATEPPRSADHRIILPEYRTENLQHTVGPRRFVRSVWRWAIFASVGLAFLCLFVPWAHRDWNPNRGTSIYGYEWLLEQNPANHWIGPAAQSMELTEFRQIRVEILIALTFLILCVLCELRFARNERQIKIIARQFRTVAAVVVVFLSIHYLIFMEILEERGAPSALLPGGGGSMWFYSPAFGYWIFTAICLALSVLNLSELATLYEHMN